VFDPDLTPSARMLADMRSHNEGFFHYAQRMSKHHYQYYKKQSLPVEKIQFFEDMAKQSLEKQKRIEENDVIDFDEYLNNYFSET